MKVLKENLMKILSAHGFIMVDFQVFPVIGVVEFEIIGKDYFPFDLFCDLESSVPCQLSTLCPSCHFGQNSFKLVLRLQ